jgi:hypothetical protein
MAARGAAARPSGASSSRCTSRHRYRRGHIACPLAALVTLVEVVRSSAVFHATGHCRARRRHHRHAAASPAALSSGVQLARASDDLRAPHRRGRLTAASRWRCGSRQPPSGAASGLVRSGCPPGAAGDARIHTPAEPVCRERKGSTYGTHSRRSALVAALSFVAAMPAAGRLPIAGSRRWPRWSPGARCRFDSRWRVARTASGRGCGRR